MKRLPNYYPDYKYEVKYLWQVIAEALVIDPLQGEELRRAEDEAREQWKRLEVELTSEY
jgi:hypothetical protein